MGVAQPLDLFSYSFSVHTSERVLRVRVWLCVRVCVWVGVCVLQANWASSPQQHWNSGPVRMFPECSLNVP
jgi:hypothetical protein